MGRKRKRWSYSAGERPNTVTVAERRFGAPVQVEVWNPHANGGEGRHVRRSLGFRVRDEDGALIPEASGLVRSPAVGPVPGTSTIA